MSKPIQIYEVITKENAIDLEDMVDKNGFHISEADAPRTTESKIASLRRRSATLGPTERALLESLLAEVIGEDNAQQVTAKYFNIEAKPEAKADASKSNTKGKYFTVPTLGEK